MPIEISLVLEAISSVPKIANAISDLASGIKKGLGGKGDVDELNKKIEDIKTKMKEFGNLGDAIKDYIELFGLSTDLNNRVDNLIKSTIPIVKKTLGTNEILLREYNSMYDEFTKHLEKFFIVNRSIDRKDEGEIAASIRNINAHLNQGSTFPMSRKYDDLGRLLMDVSNQLNHISGLSATKINDITKHLIVYPHILSS